MEYVFENLMCLSYIAVQTAKYNTQWVLKLAHI